MTAALVVLGAVWAAVAVVGCVALGMVLAERDRREQPGGKSCCPHPESEAPVTVRGQFRAVVVQR